MVQPTPRWRRQIRPGFISAVGGATLLPDRVVGPWYCLNRVRGDLLWRSRFRRPNTIAGVSHGVIVASEFRMDGPVVATLGVYAISLATGKLLWVSHGDGWWGRFLRLLDFVPDFDNEFRDTPLTARSDVIVTYQGRVLDPRTGRLIRRLDPNQLKAVCAEISSHNTAWPRSGDRGLHCGKRGTIRHDPSRRVFYLEDRDGNTVWVLEVSEKDTAMAPSPVSMRYLDPYLYLTVHSQIPPPTPPSRTQRALSWPLEPSPAPSEPERGMLWVLDARTGQVVQRIPLEGAWHVIADGDSADLLISYRRAKTNEFVIECFERQ